MDAHSEFDAMMAESINHDNKLVRRLIEAGGKSTVLFRLSRIGKLLLQRAFWNDKQKVMWNFLKKFHEWRHANNGCNFPCITYAPVRQSRAPQTAFNSNLAYAANQTYVRFTDPYSPHQLGTYPIGDATTASQEPMPLENSANMMFMVLALAQRSNDTAWLDPYWDMLTSWTDEIARTTEYPANQLCTDDFTGKLANNTNLGAKGIIALEAYAELCRMLSKDDCGKYSATARVFSKTWMRESFSSIPQRQYKMSYNDVQESMCHGLSSTIFCGNVY